MMSLGLEGLNAAIIISSPNLTPRLAHSLLNKRSQIALRQTDDPIGFNKKKDFLFSFSLESRKK